MPSRVTLGTIDHLLHVKAEDGSDWHFCCSDLKCFKYHRNEMDELVLTLYLNGQEIEVENEDDIQTFREQIRSHLNKAGHVIVH